MSNSSTKTVMLGFPIQESALILLKRLADNEGRTFASYMRRVVWKELTAAYQNPSVWDSINLENLDSVFEICQDPPKPGRPAKTRVV